MAFRDAPGSMYKLTILGDGGVGKTALTIQLCLNQFVETYDPTIEDSYRKRIILDGEPATLEVLDTAGQEEYTALRDQWIRDGEGFLLVYSITHRLSFSRVMPYYQQILRVKDGEPFGAVLVGNKLDKASERQVSVQEGEQLAKELDIPFFETSAKLNINAEHAFVEAVRLTKEKRFCGDSLDDGTETSPAPSASSSPGVLQPVGSGGTVSKPLPNTEILSSPSMRSHKPSHSGNGLTVEPAMVPSGVTGNGETSDTTNSDGARTSTDRTSHAAVNSPHTHKAQSNGKTKPSKTSSKDKKPEKKNKIKLSKCLVM